MERGSYAGAGLLAGLVTPHWNNLFLKDCIPRKEPTLEQLMKNHSLWEGLTLENFM